MKKIKYKEIVVCFTLIFGDVMGFCASLSPREILFLMEASRCRYETFKADIHYTGYTSEAEKGISEIKAKKTLSFWLDNRTKEKLIDIETEFFEKDKISLNIQQNYYYGPVYERKLETDLKTGMQKGELANPGQLRGKHFYTVDEAIWGLCSYPWDRLVQGIDRCSLVYNPKEDCYVLKFQIYENSQAPWLQLSIDPKRDYIPVQKEILFPDETLFIREECGNWVRTNNLWIPLRYTTYDAVDQSKGEYTVAAVEVNTPLGRSRLDFDFPEGVWVEDRIRGVEYRVPPKKSPSDSSEQKLEGRERMPLPPPVTEAQLAQAAEKAGRLLEESTGAGEKKPLVISPEFVWVEPGGRSMF